MAIFDKFLNSVRLVDDDDYDDDYEYDDYEDDEVEEKKRGFFGFGKKKKEEVDEEEEVPVRSKLTPMRGGKTSHKMEVCVLRPTVFDDVQEIADTLLSNRTVILNIEGTDRAQAQRIIDFMTGSCYAIDGDVHQISNFIFIMTPASVDISGDMQGIVEAFGAASNVQSIRSASGLSSY